MGELPISDLPLRHTHLMWLPDLWRIPNSLAKRALRRGSPDKANAIVARYARLRPRDPHAWLLWANVLEEGVRDQFGGNTDLSAKRLPGGVLGAAEDVIQRGLAGFLQ